MHYLKQLVSGFKLGVLLMIETAFNATPANAQLDQPNDAQIRKFMQLVQRLAA